MPDLSNYRTAGDVFKKFRTATFSKNLHGLFSFGRNRATIVESICDDLMHCRQYLECNSLYIYQSEKCLLDLSHEMKKFSRFLTILPQIQFHLVQFN